MVSVDWELLRKIQESPGAPGYHDARKHYGENTVSFVTAATYKASFSSTTLDDGFLTLIKLRYKRLLLSSSKHHHQNIINQDTEREPGSYTRMGCWVKKCLYCAWRQYEAGQRAWFKSEVVAQDLRTYTRPRLLSLFSALSFKQKYTFSFSSLFLQYLLTLLNLRGLKVQQLPGFPLCIVGLTRAKTPYKILSFTFTGIPTYTASVLFSSSYQYINIQGKSVSNNSYAVWLG